MLNMLWCADVVVLVAVIILVGLFSMQHYGTDRVGLLFAPIVLLWFLMIGGIGIFNIWKHDGRVLRAFSPVYVYRYFKRSGKDGWTSLGGILLSITGNAFYFLNQNPTRQDSLEMNAISVFLLMRFVLKHIYKPLCLLFNIKNMAGTEALFADLAHFPVLAIQIAFTVVVFPCLLLAYSGQAAYLVNHQDHVSDAFYRSIPGFS